LPGSGAAGPKSRLGSPPSEGGAEKASGPKSGPELHKIWNWEGGKKAIFGTGEETRLEKSLSFVFREIGSVLIIGDTIKNLEYGVERSRVGEEKATELGTRRPAYGTVTSIEM
jgi:hypothetical protein